MLQRPSELQNKQCAYRSKQQESRYIWVAPTSVKIENFYALCGQFVGPMLVTSQSTKLLEEGEFDEDEFVKQISMSIL